MKRETERAIFEIAEISENLLRTDKAVHDGFVKCVKDNYTDARDLSFDEIVEIITKMKEQTKRQIAKQQSKSAESYDEFKSDLYAKFMDTIHEKFSDDEITEMIDFWHKILQ